MVKPKNMKMKNNLMCYTFFYTMIYYIYLYSSMYEVDSYETATRSLRVITRTINFLRNYA